MDAIPRLSVRLRPTMRGACRSAAKKLRPKTDISDAFYIRQRRARVGAGVRGTLNSGHTAPLQLDKTRETGTCYTILRERVGWTL